MIVGQARAVVQVFVEGGEAVSVIPVQSVYRTYPDFAVVVLGQCENRIL